MPVYYNDIEPYACSWLENLAFTDQIPDGYVEERDINEIQESECSIDQSGWITAFTQWHFFAGIGGWPIALRLAGWPDDRPILTASCPCQPFSKAGKGAGFDDPRDLWPHMFSIVRNLRPPVIMGEQVDGPAGDVWLDRTRTDLESEGYAFGAVILPACSVNAPTRRYRWFWIGSRTAGGRAALERITKPGWRAKGESGQAVFQRGEIERFAGRSGGGGGYGDASGIIPLCSGPGLQERFMPVIPGSMGYQGAAAAHDSIRGIELAAGSDRGGFLVQRPGFGWGQGRAESEIWGWRPTVTGSGVPRSALHHWDRYRWVIGPDRERKTGRIKARRIPITSPDGIAPELAHGTGFPSLPRRDQWEGPGSCGETHPNSGWLPESQIRGLAPGILSGSPELRPILLSKGEANRGDKIKGYGNSIVPQVAAVVIRAYMEAEEDCGSPWTGS